MLDRILVVGIGSIGARHLRLLRERLPNADLRALRQFGGCEEMPDANGCFSDLAQACAFAPQAVVISNPAPFHLEVARALAGAGAHLLIEKPISHEIAGVAELVEFCTAHSLVLQVGYNLRLLGTLQRFRHELRSGRIGSVHAIRCEVGQHLPSWRPGTDYRKGVSARRELGGGVLLELSHELDMLRWVFGNVDWVSAWIGRQSALEIDVEDCVQLMLGFAIENGVGAVAQVGMDFLRQDATRQCTAIGDSGTLRWDGIAGRVELFASDASAWRILFQDPASRDESYRAQIDQFLDSISNPSKQRDTATGADGLAALQLISAARRSAARAGHRVHLTEGILS